jgi:hypothetical protein
MPDLFDTQQLPDDAAYWDALSARVTAQAIAGRSPTLIGWLGTARSGLIAAAILLAAALSVGVAGGRDDGEPDLATSWSAATLPRDEVGQAVLRSPSPPTVDALLFAGTPGVSR